MNHHEIGNGDVEVHPSYFTVEFNSESVPDPYNTPIKLIDDELFIRLVIHIVASFWNLEA